MSARDAADVVIVGAGVVGAIAARELAVDREVLVVDRDAVAAGATGVSAGLVSPTLFYGDRPAAARHANAFFRSFDGTAGFTFTERRRFDLVEAADVAGARRTADALAAHGFPVAYRDAAAVEERAPDLDLAGFAGAVEYGDTGWVDPYGLTVALEADAEGRGARFERDTPVERVLVEDGSVVGVETPDGPRYADHVVVAAGWRTPALLDGLVDLPVAPYRTQCLVLDPGRDLDPAFPMGRVGSEELYFRPEHNGDLLVGGSHELVDDPVAASTDVDESFRNQVAAFVPGLLRDFERAGVVNGWAGVDAATPDGRPVIDAPGDAPDGLVVATGFNGLGVTVSPVAGTAVRTLVTGEDPPFSLDPYRLARFDAVDDAFALHSTSDF
ncbi:NAD(P)/FAD-dependent oxidoreductase [Halobacteriaceae archaeon GCM10025711]